MKDGIEIKVKGTKELFKFLSPSVQNKIAMRSTNEIARRARVESRRRIRDNYNLKYKDIVIDLVKASPSQLSAYLKANKRTLNLMKFGRPKQTKTGVTVMIRKGRATNFKGAFIAQPRGGDYSKYGQSRQIKTEKPFVFRRQTRKAYPIRIPSTFSTWQLVRGKWNVGQINRLIKREGNQVMEKEIKKSKLTAKL